MKINIPHLAKLANIDIDTKDIDSFEEQLQEILRYVEKLNKVDTKNTDETHQATNLKDITRTDTVSLSLSQKEALSNTKGTKDNQFSVRSIFKQE